MPRIIFKNDRLNQSQCDETKPACRKCQKYGASCKWPEPSTRCTTDDTSIICPPNGKAFSLSLADMGTRIDNALELDSSISSSLHEPNSPHPLTVIAFQHFINSTAKTVGNPALQKVMTGEMIRLSFTVGGPYTTEGLWKPQPVTDKTILESASNVHNSSCRYASSQPHFSQ